MVRIPMAKHRRLAVLQSIVGTKQDIYYLNSNILLYFMQYRFVPSISVLIPL